MDQIHLQDIIRAIEKDIDIPESDLYQSFRLILSLCDHPETVEQIYKDAKDAYEYESQFMKEGE